MADIKYVHKDNKHSLDTFNDVLDTYCWIESALKYVSVNKPEVDISCSITFSSNQMQYECHNIEEFKKYAFGKVISIRDLYVGLKINPPWTDLYVFVKKEDNNTLKCTISSNDELLISNVVEALILVVKMSESNPQSINLHYEDKSISIGNGNTIAHSAIGTNNEVKFENIEPQKESFFSKISWNIIVPIIVGVIVAIIIFYLGLN